MTDNDTYPHGIRVHDMVRRGWLTNQHGAWAMMLVPLLVGSLLGGFSWLQLLLAFAWVVAFFFFGALGMWVKVYASAKARGGGKSLNNKQAASVRRRQKRYVPALATYGAVSALSALVLIALRPDLLRWAPVFAVLFGLALLEMWRGQERSFLARASAILASQTMTPIAFSVGSHPEDWLRMEVATVILALYFVGTIPYVKTLIRERGEKRWLQLSLAYHGVILALVTALSAVHFLTWWIPALWVILLLRAWAFPAWSARIGKPLRPALIGFSEFAVSALVVLTLVVPQTIVWP